MYRALYVFIKGCEVNDKPEFFALFGHKARRSTKLRLFIGLHLPYNPLQFQLRHHPSSLRFDVQRYRLWLKMIECRVTGFVRGILYGYFHRWGSYVSVRGKRLREQTPVFENKLLFKLSFLLYELIFVNVKANFFWDRDHHHHHHQAYLVETC